VRARVGAATLRPPRSFRAALGVVLRSKLHFDRRRFDEIERVRPRGDSHNSLNTTKPVRFLAR
jgi:hypothetical protein